MSPGDQMQDPQKEWWPEIALKVTLSRRTCAKGGGGLGRRESL